MPTRSSPPSPVRRTTPGSTTGAGGLHQSTNGGTSFAKVAGVTAAYKVGFGKAAAGQTYPAIYIWGTVGGALRDFPLR